MNSKVIRLWDHTNEPVPEEYCHWGVTDAEVEEQLQLLSRNRAQLVEKDAVEEFDAVRCRVHNGTLPVTLVYPGRKLYPELEQAVLGARVGEERTAMVEGKTITLTIERICAYVPAPVDDALIKSEKLPGIKTVEQYKTWWQEQENAERFAKNSQHFAYELLHKMAENSEMDVDEEEMTASLRERAQMIFDSQVEAGLPAEMLETVEEMTAEFKKRAASMFYPQFLHPYVVEKFRTEPLDAVMDKAVEVFAASCHYDPADVRRDMEQSPAYMEMLVTTAAQVVLCESYTNEKLKEVK